ncbi:MAG: ribose 5-phosphate isomerase B [Clostridia bacterium]
MAKGYATKTVAEYLKSKNIEIVDVGTFTSESCDYPIYAKSVAEKVAENDCDYGVLCCTTGIGMSMVANKVKGVRAALVSDAFSAEMTRRHNNANVICFGSKIVSIQSAVNFLRIFIDTPFEGGRHQRRVDMFE